MRNTSGKQNWYTPPDIIERARATMGGIDLDPASSAAANETVKAAQFYTAEDNGLAQKWRGRVWLNPPYGRHICAAFADRMAEHGNGLMLTNACTETAWWQIAALHAQAVCFLDRRLAFIDGDTGKPQSGNRFAQSLFCFGPQHVEAFSREFRDIGLIMVKEMTPTNAQKVVDP